MIQETELSERKLKILSQAIIKNYLETGELHGLMNNLAQ